ncbi:MAG TPA: porin family protein [Bacteroidales bacterium]|nr:porin family protein [Bacteroidales bacterium]
MSIRHLLILMLITLTGLTSSAQTYIGFFSGLNKSKLGGDAPKNASYKGILGINTGAFIDIKIHRMMWLSLQPSYSQEGTKISYSLRGIKEPIDSMHVRMDYFSIPLLLKVSSTNERFYAIAGIEAAYLLNAYFKSHNLSFDEDQEISQWNISMHFGAGLHIPLGFPRLFIELRYAQGLINLTDEELDKGYIPRVKTNGFKALIGIEIPLKRNKN